MSPRRRTMPDAETAVFFAGAPKAMARAAMIGRKTIAVSIVGEKEVVGWRSCGIGKLLNC